MIERNKSIFTVSYWLMLSNHNTTYTCDPRWNLWVVSSRAAPTRFRSSRWRADTQSSRSVIWANSPIITAALSSPPSSSPPLLPPPCWDPPLVAACCQTLYFGNSTWQRQLILVTPLRVQPQVALMRASLFDTTQQRQRPGTTGTSSQLQCCHGDGGTSKFACWVVLFCSRSACRGFLSWAGSGGFNRWRSYLKSHFTHLGKWAQFC